MKHDDALTCPLSGPSEPSRREEHFKNKNKRAADATRFDVAKS
jgi:hypothetical protein